MTVYPCQQCTHVLDYRGNSEPAPGSNPDLLSFINLGFSGSEGAAGLEPGSASVSSKAANATNFGERLRRFTVRTRVPTLVGVFKSDLCDYRRQDATESTSEAG